MDTLFHLKKEEFLKQGQRADAEAGSEEPLDPMVELCRYILQQRRWVPAIFCNRTHRFFIWFSFYPVFPPPMDVSHDVNLDISRSKLLDLDHGSQDHAPHVLLVPSRLKHFFRVSWFVQDILPSLLKLPSQRVNGTTFVNPSSVSKGSYAFLRYSGQASEEAVDVDIRKL